MDNQNIALIKSRIGLHRILFVILTANLIFWLSLIVMAYTHESPYARNSLVTGLPGLILAGCLFIFSINTLRDLKKKLNLGQPIKVIPLSVFLVFLMVYFVIDIFFLKITVQMLIEASNIG